MRHLSGNHPNLIEKLWVNLSNLLTAEAKDTVELLSSVLLILMLTCIGAMLMICVFFELERRSPTPANKAQQSMLLFSDQANDV